MSERRQYQRVSFTTSIEVELAAHHHQATLADISLKGALILLPSGVQPGAGTPCRLRIRLDDGETELVFEGEIAHAHGQSAGMTFTRYNLESITHLRRLLELNSADPDRVLTEFFTLVGAPH